MLEAILTGELPSTVFRRVLEANPILNNYDLSNILQEEFDELGSEAVQAVWHWKSPKRHQGLSDENLDKLLLDLFLEARYLTE